MLPEIADEGHDGNVIAELNLVKCIFQARAVAIALGLNSLDHHSRNLPDRDGSAAAVSESDVPSFHGGSSAAESQENPHDR